ncbi:MAG TPA: PEP-utilizing enzyme [Candidatus Acidoferrales bacterium]|nr:PEP-utilizing enzyme [Candidatus Acidoferrales bacterium]
MIKSVALRTDGKVGAKALIETLSKKSDLRTTVGRRVSLLFANIHMNGLSNPELHKRILGFEFQYKNYLCIQDSGSDFYYVFYDTASAKEEAKAIAAKGKGLEFAKRVIEQSVAAGTVAIKFAKSIEKADLSTKSRVELLRLFGEYVDVISALMPITVITAAVELNIEEQLKKGLLKKTTDQNVIESAMVKLTAPEKYNVPYEEQVSMLKIADRLARGQKAAAQVKEHLEMYGWLGYRFDFGKLWTEDEILERAKRVEKPAEQLEFLEKKEAAVKKDFADIIKKMKLNEEVVEEANAAKEFAWLRTYRTDAINEAVGRAKGLIDEIGRRYKIPEQYAHYLTIDEILNGKMPKSADIKGRMDSYALAFAGIEGHLLVGGEVSVIKTFAETKLMNRKADQAIRGMVANRPMDGIEGTARVVNSVEDVASFNPGDILVAPMTEPNFVPAMEKAAAFVTDEGGLLCHAAIISREMNKPCIIGTGNATKAIKDGQTIKLNLIDGTVQVIGEESGNL